MVGTLNLNDMKTTKHLNLKRGFIFGLMCVFSICSSAKDSEVITVKQGDPLILLQPKKTATFEIDYSNMMVTNGKDHEDDLLFETWMKMQDEDNDEWSKDWESKDKESCYRAFRDHFNDEVEDGIKLTKFGKDYNVILRFTMINFGPAVKYSIVTGMKKGEAKVDGELEVRDLNSGEVQLLISFHDLKGEGSFKQIGRLKGIFENLGEELSEYLENYKEELEKQQKKQKKLDKKKK